MFCAASLIISCGQNQFFAGRNLPPSGLLNRVLIAEQNPSIASKGALPFVDAFYDIRHSFNNLIPAFSISGFSGALPLTIQNMPEEQTGAVYGAGDGSYTLVNYATEKTGSPVAIPGGLSTSVFIDRARDFVYAANDQTHFVSVVNIAGGRSALLYLPNAYTVSVNPGGSVALVFVQNSTQAAGTSSCIVANPTDNPGEDPSGTPPVPCGAPNGQFSVFSVVHLTAAQSTAAINNPYYLGAQDCEPQNLPQFCLFPVSTGASASFDHPVKALFSPDGSTAYILNCGPECGGTTASVTTIPLLPAALNTGVTGGSGIALVAQSNIAIPGGVTNGNFSGNTLYLAGQQLQSDGLFAGNLSVLNTENGQLTGTYSISDGAHNKMVFADENTLWIGSAQCQLGERYKQVQAGANIAYGCLTMFNTSTNSVLLDSYKGDATGIAAITGLDKVYTAEGGQVYIYNTADGSERSNANVSVSGTAADVAYMDGASDSDNTTY
ncbi:hypothetical protein HNQ77_001932 [Silvibacterium bohemicum]|uniref:Uncharacterized protein n=1 Tax=Silvibacterium bohemicum TaxID=1577686 RepID=A0A841JRE6_9BACT|nr:hypothetical protein [Silvibacterium bohemicum]MBB6143983.1 hypothetical protein [Silvibacterium bohemicum]